MSLSRLASQNVARARGTVAPAALTRTATEDHFDLLIKYIPTETVTLFVAAMAAASALTATWPWITVRVLYYGCAALTPIVLLLIALAKRRAAGVSGSILPALLWPMFAATLSFLVWAHSFPELGLSEPQRMAWGVAALFVSLLLGLVGDALELDG
jgi:hypothetical protein